MDLGRCDNKKKLIGDETSGWGEVTEEGDRERAKKSVLKKPEGRDNGGRESVLAQVTRQK